MTLILTSTSPVGRLGLTVSGVRATTSPSTRTTHSGFSVSATAKAGDLRIGDGLGEAVMIAEVDEEQAAMIAHAVHPARKTDGLADVAFAKRAASVSAIECA